MTQILIITDAELDAMETGAHMGNRKAVEHLRPLTPAERYTVTREANLRMAYSAGWNFSGAVWQAAKDLKAGETPMLDRYDAEMAARS